MRSNDYQMEVSAMFIKNKKGRHKETSMFINTIKVIISQLRIIVNNFNKKINNSNIKTIYREVYYEIN